MGAAAVNIEKIETDLADAWIGYFGANNADYCYGGTRLAPVTETDDQVEHSLKRLMGEESRLKNVLINLALSEVDWRDCHHLLPEGFLNSTVSGARCLIKPKTQAIYDILANPNSQGFKPAIDTVFAEIGNLLNRLNGMVKLTPDFGRFADVSDLLYQFTPHVLGIGRPLGGCGGKSTYSSTGIIEGMKVFDLIDTEKRYSFIGSAGALGTDVDMYLRANGCHVAAFCDLQYDAGEQTLPKTHTVLPAVYGKFTDEALVAGDIIIATTWGRELENSNIEAIAPGTKLVLAHNLCIPAGDRGVELVEQLHNRDILALPGQLLTLGGALTSRVEWFSRQDSRFTTFDKPLAHWVVRKVIRFLSEQTLRLSQEQGKSPVLSMYDLARQAQG